jgi:hypothetical protein
MQTIYESIGPVELAAATDAASSAADDFIGLVGGIKLLLLDLRRLNESPLFTMPIYVSGKEYNIDKVN